jgi:hypothetical protein
MAMLSQYDRRQLELIASRLHIEDPDFAKSFQEWRPRPEPTVRRWPFLILMGLAGLVLLVGFVLGSFGFLFLGGVSGAAVLYAYRRHARRGPRKPRSWRHRRR